MTEPVLSEAKPIVVSGGEPRTCDVCWRKMSVGALVRGHHVPLGVALCVACCDAIAVAVEKAQRRYKRSGW